MVRLSTHINLTFGSEHLTIPTLPQPRLRGFVYQTGPFTAGRNGTASNALQSPTFTEAPSLYPFNHPGTIVVQFLFLPT
jgi:hypothetical protein